jgi:hypothetical protein
VWHNVSLLFGLHSKSSASPLYSHFVFLKRHDWVTLLNEIRALQSEAFGSAHN